MISWCLFAAAGLLGCIGTGIFVAAYKGPLAGISSSLLVLAAAFGFAAFVAAMKAAE